MFRKKGSKRRKSSKKRRKSSKKCSRRRKSSKKRRSTRRRRLRKKSSKCYRKSPRRCQICPGLNLINYDLRSSLETVQSDLDEYKIEIRHLTNRNKYLKNIVIQHTLEIYIIKDVSLIIMDYYLKD